jgi:hypothetical protein
MLLEIYNKEGFQAFYRSLYVRVGYTMVGGMLFFGTFETVNEYLSMDSSWLVLKYIIAVCLCT